MMENINLAFLLVIIALMQYLWFTVRTGFQRNKYNVKAPATSGHEMWERLHRVQQNTLEQLIIFIPAVIAFAYYTSTWVLIPGGMFLLGRQIYSMMYLKDPATRTLGMSITLLANAILLLGSLYGVIKSFL